MIPLEEIVCAIDDFCKQFQQEGSKNFITSSKGKRPRACQMSLSEIMMTLVMFHFSHYRTFKDFYIDCILRHLTT